MNGEVIIGCVRVCACVDKRKGVCTAVELGGKMNNLAQKWQIATGLLYPRATVMEALSSCQ